MKSISVYLENNFNYKQHESYLNIHFQATEWVFTMLCVIDFQLEFKVENFKAHFVTCDKLHKRCI